MNTEKLIVHEEDIIEYDTPKIKKKNQEDLEITKMEEMKANDKNESRINLTDKYIQLEDKINGKIYELFNNSNFITLLEKYDINNEKETLKILNEELTNNETQKENYESLLEIKRNYSELTHLFNELNCNEENKHILIERIRQNDKKLLDSSLLNNQLISSDNNGGIFKSNDYLKLLLLDLRILKKGVSLNDEFLLEKEMITDMLNRNRVHFFTLRMNDLLQRHIEDVDTLNKKDEDSFYLESVLRKKVNLIHKENLQLKEQINRDFFLINKKDQEINKLSFTLFSLQDQLDNSIINLRMKLKSKYGNLIHQEDNTFDSMNSGELPNNNVLTNDQISTNPLNIKELSQDNRVLFINKEIDNQNNYLNTHAHIRRHDYNINNNILKGGAELLRINNDQTEVPKNSVISGIEKRFHELKSSIPSKLNIFSQCKHIKSAISTPRDSVDQINNHHLIITPVDAECELIEKDESKTQYETSFDERINGNELAIIQKQSDNKSEDDHKDITKTTKPTNDIKKIAEEIEDDKCVNNKDDCHKNESNISKNVSELEKIKKSNTRPNLSLQNYKTTDKKANKIISDQKNVQENERINGKNLVKSGKGTDFNNSKTSSKEHIKVINDQLSNFTKPTVNSLSKKRTKSKERLVDDYNNSNSNSFYRTNSKTNLISMSNLKGGIFDDSYMNNESIISADILSKRNLRKMNSDLETIVPKVKTTNLVNNSTFIISNKSSTVDKYLNDQKIEHSNVTESNDQPNYGTNAPIVRAYKATIQTINSINEFQASNNIEKNINTINKNVASNETDSYLIYSPEVKLLDLQPTNYIEANNLKTTDTNLTRSNTTPLLNNTSNNNNNQYYPANLLNSRSNSSFFNMNATQNITNTTLLNGNINIVPNNNTNNNLQYVAPVPTPITIDAVQQKIVFPNNFHALYK
ncbi:unnamed protein product [Cryptosporidium hominis]|uniref:Uncharacterized protein n=1 Tax=Cryptosporidium hominis TaxID=237895 RepID=A0A0S4TDQ1_CRYHO|nr:hypothetical protein ChTU502y2012_413g0140 [Cryptosporidium hominis]PPA62618.1 hypothetical protein ChUKH1_12575 [Cryptosporidium hominis]PPS93333.1 Uncharacterized protein GY17_00003714 [Cryptosporidium hominis]CUV05502.1 unnamed protein product [Cryptosporidium hominis]|eukprot:PPS93333.1 Uncharacterized protein GY17_00003714 [Cryptosporidium hominis]